MKDIPANFVIKLFELRVTSSDQVTAFLVCTWGDPLFEESAKSSYSVVNRHWSHCFSMGCAVHMDTWIWSLGQYRDLVMDWTTGSRKRIYILTTAFRPALGHTQATILWVQGVLSPRIKRREREAIWSSGGECEELYLHSPIRLHGMVLS